MDTINNKTISREIQKQETFNILAYSDIFNYPLSKKEIYERGKLELYDLDLCLENLLKEKKIYFIDDFYLLQHNSKLVERRKEQNRRAKKSISIAKFITRIIINFPFIRSVLLSGSISKNCMDKKSDIDFFIITEPGRLWIVNLFCSIFRRTILLNSSKYFCFNYLVDSEHLLIDEKSIYTAIEIKTLIPLFGYSHYRKMLKENEWANSYFPKYPPLPNGDIVKKQTIIQRLGESIFTNKAGEWLDKWLLHYSIKKRKKKLNPKFFKNPNYYTNLQRHVAKSHINDNYPDILDKYRQKIGAYKSNESNSIKA